VLFVIVSCAPAGLPPTPGVSPTSTNDQPAFVLDLETAGQITQVSVFDPEGMVVEVRPADAPETTAAMAALSASDIVALPGRSDEWVVVGWLVSPCDRHGSLTVVATVITVQLPPRPGCDAIAIGRVVAIRVADPTRAAIFTPLLIDSTILPEVVLPTPVAPPPTAEG